jgi:hypothetical protein
MVAAFVAAPTQFLQQKGMPAENLGLPLKAEGYLSTWRMAPGLTDCSLFLFWNPARFWTEWTGVKFTRTGRKFAANCSLEILSVRKRGKSGDYPPLNRW